MENNVSYTNAGHCSIGNIVMADFDSGAICLGTVIGVHSDNTSPRRERINIKWFSIKPATDTFPPLSMKLHCEKL